MEEAMNWKFCYALDDSEIPDIEFDRWTKHRLYAIDKEAIKRLDYCSLREVADVLKQALEDVRDEIAIAEDQL